MEFHQLKLHSKLSFNILQKVKKTKLTIIIHTIKHNLNIIDYKGYILFDNSSVNVALSLVSQMSALVASVAEVPIMQQNGLKMLLDARSWTESGLFGMWQQGQYNFSKTYDDCFLNTEISI